MIIDQSFIDKYFTDKYKHSAYDLTVEKYKELKTHFEGEFPEKLISERRPNESEFSFEYRKKIYQPKTKAVCSRIISSLNKIRRSPDWVVKFDSHNNSILESESPEQYINYNFPFFSSITNWIFSVLLKNYLIDSNAVCLVQPMEQPEEGKYLKPFPIIFNSDRVIDFKEGEYCVLESQEKSHFKDGRHTNYNGKIIYIVTDLQIAKYVQVDTKGRMELLSDYAHGLGYMPAFKLGGQFCKVLDKLTIWESRISGILPDMNEFVRMYSDFQSQLVQHVFSEKWMWGASDECETCNGSGHSPENVKAVCHTCLGTKRKKVSQFSITNVKPANTNLGQQTAPIPPLGYISKESVAEMTSLLDSLLDKAELKALSAINMEFLAKVPMSESGVAKSVDRDEANNFVHSICEDIVIIADRVCKMVIDYRYSVFSEKESLYPSISVPETYDLINSNYLLAEMQAAQAAKMNASYINKMQVEIAAKKYPNDVEFIHVMECIAELNPFPSIPVNDIVLMAQNRYITDVDAVISCNIDSFVTRAIEENHDFVNLEYADKMKKMQEYAAVKIAETKVTIDIPIE